MAHESPQVDEYIANLQPGRQEALRGLRALIFETVPEIEETIQYRMPVYRLDENVVAMASQKHYLSLYMDPELVAKYADELGHLDCGKSCIRFKRLEQLPLDTVRKIIRETVEKQAAG